MGAGLLDDDERGFMERRNWSTIVLSLFFIALCLTLLLLIVYDSLPPEFWVKLSTVEGLDRSADAVTAPPFHRSTSPYESITTMAATMGSGPLCGKGDRLDVAYAGVPTSRSSA